MATTVRLSELYIEDLTLFIPNKLD
jgi:hypothetical protein